MDWLNASFIATIAGIVIGTMGALFTIFHRGEWTWHTNMRIINGYVIAIFCVLCGIAFAVLSIAVGR
jgi:hypothetical protein